MNPPEDLKDALRGRSLIICAGPGIDEAAGLPSMEMLAWTLFEAASEVVPAVVNSSELQRALADGRYSEALSHLQLVLGRGTFQRTVIDELSSHASISPLVAAIARLHEHLRAVYTTSLVDGLFTQAFRGRWPSHDDPRPHLAQKRGLIFHLRGTLGRVESWVLTAEQESRQLRQDSERGQLLGAVYRAHRLLLIGFEIDSPALQALLDMLPSTADGQTPEHFLAISGPCSADARRRLARYGFVVLSGDVEQLLAALGGDNEIEASASPTGECPYPGLEAFDNQRASVFFGRHVEVSQAAARLGVTEAGVRRRWLAVEGPSGIGKSSFVHAGIVPALHKGFAAGTPIHWKVACMRPGVRPLQNLVDAVYESLDLPIDAGSRAAVVERVNRSPSALAEIISDRIPDGYGLLLVIDQLEEAVTFADENERAPFGLAVAHALDIPTCYLITTIRSDFVPALQARLPSLASRLNEGAERYALPPISRVGLRDAIVEPAAREGVTIEPELVELMLADATKDTNQSRSSVESSESALPLVAHVLRALWDSGAADDRLITTHEYHALGGVQGALSRSAEAALVGFDAQTLGCAEALLLALVRVHPSGGATRRTLTRDEAVAVAGGSARGEQLLLRLSSVATGSADKPTAGRARLLVVHRDGASDRVDLVHEALLRDCPRYHNLIRQNWRQLQFDEELARRAKRWFETGQPEDDLPAGQELVDLLAARPHGHEAPQQANYQRELRLAFNRRRQAQKTQEVLSIVMVVLLVAATLTIYLLTTYQLREFVR